MNKISENITFFLKRFDKWSDETIKNSFPAKLITKTLLCTAYLKSNEHISTLINAIFISSIGLLFCSLSLPQFATDRYGIGIIIAVCFFFFLVNLVLRKENPLSFNSLDFLLLIFILISIISTFSSYFFEESLKGLSKYITFFIFYFTIKITLLNSSKKVFCGLWALLILCGIITALIGIRQYFTGVTPLANWEDPNSEETHTRVYSTLLNPNLLAGYLLPLIPISIILPFTFKSSWIVKLFFLTGCCSMIICLIFTGSRGAYLGFLASLFFALTTYLFFLYRQIKQRKNKKNFVLITSLFIVILSFIAASILFPIFTERLSTIFTLREHTSNNHRINVWLSCLKMIKDCWVIGIGPGNDTFRLGYGLYMISSFDALGSYNIILEFAIQLGIIGCFVFILIFVISFIKLHYLFWSKRSIFAWGIFVSLTGLITQGMVDTIFLRAQIFIPFWLLLASLGRLESKVTD